MIIDGQQRLTSLSLLLLVLAKSVGDVQFLPELSAKNIREKYLIWSDKTGAERYRIFLTEKDRDTFFALIDGNNLPDHYSKRLVENFKFFEKNIKKDSSELQTIWRGLHSCYVVEIGLDIQKNDPQIIFESINATGKQLRQSDNVRNYILMDLNIETQEKFYKNYWQKIEKIFGDSDFDGKMDVFMRRYLLIKNQLILGSVYEAFRAYVEGKAGGKEQLEYVLHDFLKFARYYHYITGDGQEPDRELAEAFSVHGNLPYGSAYPFLLQLYDDYEKKILLKDDFLQILRLVESYLFRRGICSREF